MLREFSFVLSATPSGPCGRFFHALKGDAPMGTTDNFDSPAYSGPIAAADTIPVISASTARAATARVDQMLRGGYGTPVSVNTAGANTLTAANVLAGVYV